VGNALYFAYVHLFCFIIVLFIYFILFYFTYYLVQGQKTPLPPPVSSATLLREKCFELVSNWTKEHGRFYKQLGVGEHFLSLQRRTGMIVNKKYSFVYLSSVFVHFVPFVHSDTNQSTSASKSQRTKSIIRKIFTHQTRN
jgi:hypothetical protein